MIGNVLNKEIATCFWVGRDNDGQCHVFNDEPVMLGNGDNLVWCRTDCVHVLDVTSSDLFSCVQPGCLYKVAMSFRLTNCEDAKLLLFTNLV